jgi:hypothetical protein
MNTFTFGYESTPTGERLIFAGYPGEIRKVGSVIKIHNTQYHAYDLQRHFAGEYTTMSDAAIDLYAATCEAQL